MATTPLRALVLVDDSSPSSTTTTWPSRPSPAQYHRGWPSCPRRRSPSRRRRPPRSWLNWSEGVGLIRCRQINNKVVPFKQTIESCDFLWVKPTCFAWGAMLPCWCSLAQRVITGNMEKLKYWVDSWFVWIAYDVIYLQKTGKCVERSHRNSGTQTQRCLCTYTCYRTHFSIQDCEMTVNHLTSAAPLCFKMILIPDSACKTLKEQGGVYYLYDTT